MAAPFARALGAVRAGRPVVYPTDTLWGLGVSPSDARAVLRLTQLKGRPAGQPISVAFSSHEEVEPMARLGAPARSFLRRRLPGPFTVLVPATPRARRAYGPAILGRGGTLGVRIPDHAVARRFLAESGPLTATSANRHGAPPCRTLSEAQRTFGRSVGAYLAGLPAPSGNPSTLIDLTGPTPRAVRRG